MSDLAQRVTLLAGLFDNRVSNDEVFAIIGPAFNTIIGAFVGGIAGIHIGKQNGV